MEMDANSNTLCLTTYTKLGGAEEIGRRYVVDALDKLKPGEKKICVLLFDRLVTSSGGKVAYREDNLVQDAGKNGSRVPKILQALVDERILHSMAPRVMTGRR